MVLGSGTRCSGWAAWVDPSCIVWTYSKSSSSFLLTWINGFLSCLWTRGYVSIVLGSGTRCSGWAAWVEPSWLSWTFMKSSLSFLFSGISGFLSCLWTSGIVSMVLGSGTRCSGWAAWVEPSCWARVALPVLFPEAFPLRLAVVFPERLLVALAEWFPEIFPERLAVLLP